MIYAIIATAFFMLGFILGEKFMQQHDIELIDKAHEAASKCDKEIDDALRRIMDGNVKKWRESKLSPTQKTKEDEHE